MKRYLSIALMLGLALGAAACDDDFLTTIPQDVIAAEVFFQTERDFTQALNGVYREMVGREMDQMYFDGATDLGYSQQDWMRQHAYAMGQQDGLTGWGNRLWADMFRGISRANEVLVQLEANTALPAATKAQIEGQARFLRGYFYHQLLWLYGPVPLFTKVPSVTEAGEVARATRQQTYDFVMADLTAAAGLLPETWPAAQYGRVTKGAANAYRARTALYEASHQKYRANNAAGATPLFQLAAEAAQAVINSGRYSLYPNFRELFMYPGQQTAEVIFDYQRVKGSNGWWAWVGFGPHSMGGNTDNTPTRKLVDMFEMANGLPITDPASGYNPAPPVITYSGNVPTVVSLGMFANRDPRLYGTVLFPGAAFNNTVYNSYPDSPTPDKLIMTNFYNTQTGFHNMKYVDPADQADQWNSALNIIKMRYADVLLMYAEAKIELGQFADASVANAINQVRARVNMPPKTLTSQEEAIQVIRHERAVELALEGLRLADIRRWNIAHQVMPGQVRGITVPGSTEPVVGMWNRQFTAPRDYLWPVPTRERDLNPNLEQNPGY
jgi:starch-binding outer membrane protein, SusD/RagB family